MTAQIDPQVNPAKPLKNVRQEQVLLKILAGESNTRAYQSVYKCKNDNTAGVLCNRLLRNVKVSARLQYLQQQTATKAVMSVQRRKEVLSVIAEEVGMRKPGDYMQGGKDGAWIDFGPDSPNQRSVISVKSRTEVDEDGNGQTVTEEIRLAPLADAIHAIDTLNKMDRLYSEHVNQTQNDVIAILDRIGMRALEPGHTERL